MHGGAAELACRGCEVIAASSNCKYFAKDNVPIARNMNSDWSHRFVEEFQLKKEPKRYLTYHALTLAMILDDLQFANEKTICKCCAGPSLLCGVVDFSRGGADYHAGKKIDPYVGVPFYYYRCGQCGFIFTRALDAWTRQSYAEWIYNLDYERQDPDYLDVRPTANAKLVSAAFPELRHEHLLDYGSGNGQFERRLQDHAFTSVCSYDPYGSCFDPETLQRRYRVVFAYEVFEHHHEPLGLVKALAELLDDDGAILFSTLLVPSSVLDTGIENWWYCMPRNGHISFYTPCALASLASYVGMRASSFNDGLHLLYRKTVPAWASRYPLIECKADGWKI